MNLNEIEIELAKTNAQLDRLLQLIYKLRPGVLPTEPQVANIVSTIREAALLNAAALKKVHLWTGGDLAMDEGAILEVPTVEQINKVVNQMDKPADTVVVPKKLAKKLKLTTDLSQIAPSFNPKGRSQGVIFENASDESLPGQSSAPPEPPSQESE